MLFEYNFGFFLKKKLKKIRKFIGYQHGIFTKNLMWLYLVKYNNRRDVMPDQVVCNRKKSIKFYKENFNNVVFRKKVNNLNKLVHISKNGYEKNLIVFLGQHDTDDCLYYFFNNNKYKDKKIYFKLHPNNKKLIKLKAKNFYFVNKINKKKKYRVFLSPTTTLIYDFIEKKMKFNLIKFNYKIDLWR